MYNPKELRYGLGPNGICYCPICGYQVSHKRGMPCFTILCPRCGITLMRK